MLLNNSSKKKKIINLYSFNYAVFAVLLSIIFFTSGFFFHRSHYYYKVFRPKLLGYLKEYKPDRYIEKKIKNNLNDFNLHVNFKNYKKLEYYRQKALTNPKLLNIDSSSYVSGILESHNGMQRVELRVKGNLGDHHNSFQPSFRVKVKDGTSISRPLSKSKIFPSLLIDMIAVGEETGDMPAALKHITRRYDNELDRLVKTCTTILEPLLIVIVALIVGSIAVCLLLPVLTLTDSLSM